MSDTPERIYGWLNSQLSIARHYGGINYNGKRYVIAPNEEGPPSLCGRANTMTEPNDEEFLDGYEDYDQDEPECPRCRGDGCDPWCDYLLPCPVCQGEQAP